MPAPFRLTEKIEFPDPRLADEDGLLAIGGDLSVDRLLLAYQLGIFPWFSGDTPHWYSPDPRCVLIPEDLYISKSMRTLIRRDAFHVTCNQAFEQVIRNCKSVRREGQWGTWITEDMMRAYLKLHELGHAWSFEAWQDGELAGGLYGIRMGCIFFGESMFSHRSNASKYAFIKCVQQLEADGVILIDCQVYTEHLLSLGAHLTSRDEFLEFIASFFG